MLSRLCLFFDQLLMLERAAMKAEVTSMFKNMLLYTYQSHLEHSAGYEKFIEIRYSEKRIF